METGIRGCTIGFVCASVHLSLSLFLPLPPPFSHSTCEHVIVYMCICVCWPLPSNHRQITGYGMGVGDHRVG